MKTLSVVATLLIPLLYNAAYAQTKKWEDLLANGLNQWDVFMGVPHAATGIAGYEQSDGMKGKPLGLNQDPRAVYQVKDIDGVPTLCISGEIYAGLSTKASFENYHLTMEVKWGEKKYAPRLKKKRDSGILYHAGGPHGAMWNVWMRSQEFQVQEGDCGDYYRINNVLADITASKREGKPWSYDKNAELVTFGAMEKAPGFCKKAGDNELPNGQWNTLELICFGDKAIHVVNGQVMLAISNSKAADGKGGWEPLTKGKIQIQSEGAEVYYRNIKVKKIKRIPKGFAEQL